MVISFEFLDRNRIATIDRGVYAEEITEKAYSFYMEEVLHTGRTDIDIIPPSYYRKLISDNVELLNNNLDIPERIRNVLKPYQLECIKRMVSQKRIINACIMGMGKTIQAICSMMLLRSNEYGDLVVCPGSLRSNWGREFKKWAPDVPIQIISKVGSSTEHIQSCLNQTFTFKKGVTIISYELFSKLSSMMKASQRGKKYFQTIVCDESHYLKDTETSRFTNIRPFLVQVDNLFLMSGTPSPNRPVELYAQLKLLDSKTFDSKRIFTDRYCNGFTDRWGVYNARGSSKTTELSQLLFKYMVRCTNVEKDISTTTITRTVSYVNIGPTVLEKDHEIEMKNIIKKISEHGISVDLQSEISQLFHETASAKIEPIIRLLEERFVKKKDFDEKVILFCTHMVMFSAVTSFFTSQNIKHIGIHGGTIPSSRDKLIGQFLDFERDDAIDVAILTLGTCSTGINLIPVRKMIFLELQWTPSIIHQAECRINRIGGASDLEYEYILARRTLDMYVYNMLFQKNQIITDIIDNGENVHDAFDFSSKCINSLSSMLNQYHEDEQ